MVPWCIQYWMGDKFNTQQWVYVCGVRVLKYTTADIPIVLFCLMSTEYINHAPPEINPISSGFIPVFNQMRCTPMFSVLFNAIASLWPLLLLLLLLCRFCIAADSCVPINAVHFFKTSDSKRMQFKSLMKTESYGTLCKLKFNKKKGWVVLKCGESMMMFKKKDKDVFFSTLFFFSNALLLVIIFSLIENEQATQRKRRKTLTKCMPIG